MTDGDYGKCTFSQPIPAGEYRLIMDVLGMNASVVIPPSKGMSVTLDMNISPTSIKITSSVKG